MSATFAVFVSMQQAELDGGGGGGGGRVSSG